MVGEDQEMEKENENGQRLQDAERKCGQSSELDGVGGQAITVLLVEDDPMTSRIVETLLKTCLYEGAETSCRLQSFAWPRYCISCTSRWPGDAQHTPCICDLKSRSSRQMQDIFFDTFQIHNIDQI